MTPITDEIISGCGQFLRPATPPIAGARPWPCIQAMRAHD